MGHVSIDEREGIAVLTLDRPPANAMDLALLGDLVEGVQRLATDVPRAVVIAGREGFFSAGADLKAVPGYGPAEQRRMVEAINAMALGV
jgi:enoyl-CoA hydratase/carnithine racemase